MLLFRRLKRVVGFLALEIEGRWRYALSKLAKVLRLSVFSAVILFPPQLIAAEQGAVSLDIDQDGAVSPLSDGLLLLRALFGFEGVSLVAGALGTNAENQDPENVLQEINALKPYIDVDQDGTVAPLSDGLLILRSLFGFEGTALVNGALNFAEANRVDPDLIRNYISQVRDGFRVALQFSGDVRGNTSEGFSVSGMLGVEHDLGPVLEPVYSILIAPEYGTVEIDVASGAWGYIPDDNVNGNDVFGVSVIDDFGQPSFIEIPITISQVDDAASFGGDLSGSTSEGIAVTGTITATDAIDGLTAPNFKIAIDAVEGGATIDVGTGVWTYIPAENYNGVDSFTVSVTDDDGNTAVQVVSLTIAQVEKPLFKIQQPMLGSLTYGVATLFLMESGGFSSDGRLMLVKATYTDNGEAGNKLRYAYFLYDVDSQEYLYSLNERLFGQQAREYDVKEAVISGVEENFRILAQTREKSSAQEQLVLIDNSEILSSDLFQPILGAPIEPNIERFLMSGSGRFIAIQTTNAQLAPDADLDTNDVSDIYLIDLFANDIRRISFVGGAETNDPANLASILEIGSIIRIGMISAAPYVSPSKIDTNSANPSNSELQKSDLYLSETAFSTDGPSGVSTFTLISKTPDGIASGLIDTGYLVFDTSNGIFFNSSSAELSDDDENSENDGFRLAENEIELISSGSVTNLASGAQIVSVSADGQNLLALTTSAELVINSVQQLVLFDFDQAQERVISVSEGMALSDGWVISGVISPDGGRIAFTSDATNLVSGDSITTSGDLYVKVLF